jgi:hypothetical protein
MMPLNYLPANGGINMNRMRRGAGLCGEAMCEP